MDLIRGVGFRSGGRGDLGARDGGGTSPELCSAAAGGRRWPISAFPGSIRPGFGSRAVYATRVMPLGTQLGSGRTATASVATAAGLLGETCRRAGALGFSRGHGLSTNAKTTEAGWGTLTVARIERGRGTGRSAMRTAAAHGGARGKSDVVELRAC